MKNLSQNKWIFVVIVIALVSFGFYYFYNNSKSANPAQNSNAAENTNSDEKLPAILLQEAIRQNVTVSDYDLDKEIKILIKRANMTEEDYYSFILKNYPSLDEFREKVRDNLKIIKLVNENVNMSSIKVTDKDVDDFINENKGYMPMEQLENNATFKEMFYRLAKQQLLQKKQQQLVNEYVDSVLKKSLDK